MAAVAAAAAVGAVAAVAAVVLFAAVVVLEETAEAAAWRRLSRYGAAVPVRRLLA